MTDFLGEAKALFEYSRSLRRDFHRNPELGFKEVRTASIINRELTNLGLEVTTGIAETGVLGILEGKMTGPTVLLRFDMDALPISELNETDYKSINPGVMHACGHDAHVSIGLTVARILTAHRDEIQGRIKFVFQPAEEGLGGAAGMIEAGVLGDPVPDYCLAMHVWNERPVGWVAAVPGPLMAGADMFRIQINGRGGHGAMPDQTVDPILAGVQIVAALQSIVSRNVPPLKTAVVSVTAFLAGEAYNIIPQTAELRGTIRSFEPEVRTQVIERFAEIIQDISRAMGCSVQIDFLNHTPAVINNARIATLLQKAISSQGEANVDSTYRTMVSEDMAEFMNRVPGCYLMVGSADPGKETNYPHHHPRFDIDEEVLVNGAGWMAASAVALMEQHPAV